MGFNALPLTVAWDVLLSCLVSLCVYEAVWQADQKPPRGPQTSLQSWEQVVLCDTETWQT